jgi:hypothetical protein
VRKRAKAGRLTRLQRGVYAVGHAPLTGDGRTMAAVLAYGPRAVASHRTAAGLHGLRVDNSPRTEISLPRQSARSRPGITAHAAPSLRACHVTNCHGIPCTSVARTLLDLADVVSRRQLERAVEQAEVLRLFDLTELREAIAHANGRHGAAVLSAVLAATTDEPVLTASELEEAFLALCRDAGLPAPAVNEWVRVDDGPPLKADFLWRSQRLIVELDGWGAHGTRTGFESDRRGDQRARRAGLETLRFTHRQVAHDPGWVAETTVAMLAR